MSVWVCLACGAVGDDVMLRNPHADMLVVSNAPHALPFCGLCARYARHVCLALMNWIWRTDPVPRGALARDPGGTLAWLASWRRRDWEAIEASALGYLMSRTRRPGAPPRTGPK